MPTEETCEMGGCSKPATHITSTETKYIVICDDCYNSRYKS